MFTLCQKEAQFAAPASLVASVMFDGTVARTAVQQEKTSFVLTSPKQKGDSAT